MFLHSCINVEFSVAALVVLYIVNCIETHKTHTSLFGTNVHIYWIIIFNFCKPYVHIFVELNGQSNIAIDYIYKFSVIWYLNLFYVFERFGIDFMVGCSRSAAIISNLGAFKEKKNIRMKTKYFFKSIRIDYDDHCCRPFSMSATRVILSV